MIKTRALVVAAAVAALAAGGTASAQPGPEHNRHGHGEAQQGPGHRQPPSRPGGRPSSRPETRPQTRPAPSHGGRFVYRGRQHERIREPAFRYPHGYAYRRWRLGERLPPLFLAAPFYFDSWANYGFGPPPPGYRWVRYGPDLLLVSLRTGRISRVIYGVFY